MHNTAINTLKGFQEPGTTYNAQKKPQRSMFIQLEYSNVLTRGNISSPIKI